VPLPLSSAQWPASYPAHPLSLHPGESRLPVPLALLPPAEFLSLSFSDHHCAAEEIPAVWAASFRRAQAVEPTEAR